MKLNKQEHESRGGATCVTGSKRHAVQSVCPVADVRAVPVLEAQGQLKQRNSR